MSGSLPYPQPVDLANAALSLLGSPAIVTMNDPTPAARACNRRFGLAANLLLTSRDWKWATARLQLVQATELQNGTTVTAPVSPPWSYMYPRPADCLKARYLTYGALPGAPSDPPPAYAWGAGAPEGVGRNDDRIPFDEGLYYLAGANNASVQTPVILTTYDPPVLVYTAQVTNTAIWEPAFASAFTIQLAAEIAFAVTGNGQVAQAWRQEAADAVAALQGDGQNQGVSQQNAGDAPWVRARG